MKRIFYTGALCFCLFSTNLLSSQAQGVTVSGDGQGIYFVGNTYSNLTGSPYLYEDWAKGYVKLANGTVYRDLFVKYDQVKDELIFLNEKKSPQLFSQPVTEFTIVNINEGVETKRTFINGFQSMGDANSKTYYELLVAGNTKLVKHISKKVVEERGNGSILVNKQVKETAKYYLSMADNLYPIKRDQKAILVTLKSKATELTSFIKENNLNLKKDGDLITLIYYYNTL
ncbi:hypothetical protein [Pedobacter sp.]|uniref:hypothetical protein n=1 Tax=Pedobacter sp. TaxID=1411316 RepID=UPI003D7F3B1E